MCLCPHLKQGLDGIESRLGVGGVEDGLHEEQVHPSIQQGPGLLAVGVHQFFKLDVPEQNFY